MPPEVYTDRLGKKRHKGCSGKLTVTTDGKTVCRGCGTEITFGE